MELLTRVIFAAILCAFVLVDKSMRTNAVCCRVNSCGTCCDDWTKGTPCCGRGRCNIFCCNCDGGCRKGKRSNDEINTFSVHDLNQDSKISFDEMVTNLNEIPRHRVLDEFKKMDQDESGFIEAKEYDSDL